jgi:hypothetical protein
MVQTSKNVPNASLTASEIISSTRNLSGWEGTPTTELSSLGGGSSQVISGVLSGEWNEIIVIWYQSSVVQMTWKDAKDKPQQQYVDNMLASFKFTS